ncbi:hypothetical protein V499_06945 [Pseudogymnoascus sp. VKM F-103]|nr:hypothetical protein V499_06945 [Pseudogymnoascus sp. VKM F-103]
MSLYEGVVFSAPPPEGVIPDAKAPHNATALVVCIGIFLPLAIISTAIRISTRDRIKGNVAIDDYMMSGALMNLVAAIIFCAATGLAKTSILLFYQRIFPSKIFHWAVWGLATFTVGYSAASVFVNIFSCTPVQATWEAGFGILTDFATVIAPMPVMCGLQPGLKQKLGVGGILTTGGFVCIISIIRLYSSSVLLRSTDLTYDTPPALMCRNPAMLYDSNTGVSGSRKRGQSYQLESMANPIRPLTWRATRRAA